MNFLSLDIYKGKYKTFFEILKNPEKSLLVFTPNPEMLLQASEDKEFQSILEKADYLVPDGNGLYLASLMQKKKSYFRSGIEVFFRRKSCEKKYGELIKGSDLTRDILEFARLKDKKILIIDNYRITHPKNPFERRKMRIQSQMESILHREFPKLSCQVFFDGEMSPDALAHHIELNQIDYVFACSGMKKQEKLLIEIFSYLPVYLKVVGLGVGSSLDYILGLQRRAPLLCQKLGIEWLYRLILSPSRYRRIVDAVWRFPRRILKMR